MRACSLASCDPVLLMHYLTIVRDKIQANPLNLTSDTETGRDSKHHIVQPGQEIYSYPPMTPVIPIVRPKGGGDSKPCMVLRPIWPEKILS